MSSQVVESVDLAWLAGFLEGEGSFGCYSKGRRICIQVAQVQRWPLDKVQGLAGGIVRGPYRLNKHRNGQLIHHWSHDRGPATLALMRRLHHLMSPSRQAQIDRAIEAYLAVPHPGCGWRRRIAVVAVLVLALTGCGTTKNMFTNPTGDITIRRQQFVDTYARVRELYLTIHAQAVQACRANQLPAEKCLRIAEVHEEAKALDFEVRAFVGVPETELDWAMIVKVVGFAVKLVL